MSRKLNESVHLVAEESEDLGSDESLSATDHKDLTVHPTRTKTQRKDSLLLLQKCMKVVAGCVTRTHKAHRLQRSKY